MHRCHVHKCYGEVQEIYILVIFHITSLGARTHAPVVAVEHSGRRGEVKNICLLVQLHPVYNSVHKVPFP